jgi:RimJ/RimL family protein N-acetyltransferase
VTHPLSGALVQLRPLAHATDLLLAATDESIWRYMPVPAPKSLDNILAYIDAALKEAETGTSQPFAIIHQPTGKAIGSTRYLDIQPHNRSLEIGWAWIGAPWQRTAVNTECKYLLLRNAFESMNCVRVQLKTDVRNQRSQQAIHRIGAKLEGTLRKHRINDDGHIRDSVYFSVLAEEWPTVKARLERMLTR